MVESLQDLEQQFKDHMGKLYYFHGENHAIIKKIIESEKIDALFINKDYTPFSRARDESIKELCLQHGIAFETFDDALLHAPQEALSPSNKPYTIFTPFWKNSAQLSVPEPVKMHHTNWYHHAIESAHDHTIFEKVLIAQNPELAESSGSTAGEKILKHISHFQEYQNTRDIPSLPTTRLSAHNKFGTLSIRHIFYEMQKQLGKNHPLIRQLYWRDFFTQLAYFTPRVFGHAFHEKYEHLKFSASETHFARWCEGQTGFPIVDAGMRELNTTGFMHNRTRMIVASFLTKDLHIDWRWGEKYFAQQLVDYDPAVNNGNWQWSASTGADATPYFRIFNPWLQQPKFDPECIYIKKWIPELRNVSVKTIHSWDKIQDTTSKYPRPMVDHAIESHRTKLIYKHAS